MRKQIELGKDETLKDCIDEIDINCSDERKAKLLKASELTEVYTKAMAELGAGVILAFQLGRFDSDDDSQTSMTLNIGALDGDLVELSNEMLLFTAAVATASSDSEMLSTAMRVRNLRDAEKFHEEMKEHLSPLLLLKGMSGDTDQQINDAIAKGREVYITKQLDIAPGYMDESDLTEGLALRFGNEFDAMVEEIEIKFSKVREAGNRGGFKA